MRAPRIRAFSVLPEPVRFLLTVLGIPILCAFPLSIVILYLLGGAGLLRFAVTQLTWKLTLRVFSGIIVLALVTLARHLYWYSDEPPPMWFRKSIWVNIVEILILLGVVALGICALRRF